MSNHVQSNAAQLERRLIESDEFAFEFISELAEMESWRKEVYRPIYHVHKWWAKRLGSVFRGILLGSVLPGSERLQDVFYRKHSFSGLTVFDPFMGSGTTIGEAHKLGFTALGRDINPVACEAVRVALGPLDRDALLKAFGELSSEVGERIRNLYRTTDAEGHEGDALYYFWIKVLSCPSCSAAVDLFSSYLFARNAYPDRKPDVRVYCPHCSGIFCANVNDERVKCPRCEVIFAPHDASANGASARCSRCKQTFAIAKVVQATGNPPLHRMFAKLVLTNRNDKQYLPVSSQDLQAYSRCSEELARSNLALPTLELEEGHNTRQVLNYGYRSWRQFFNDRQLLALGWLRTAISELRDSSVRDAMLTTFSGTLEFNNMFASYKGEGTGAIRHMFSHHILKPERLPIEGNVWGTQKSSGSFSTLFKSRLLRAVEYRAAPFEVAVEKDKGAKSGKRVYCGSDAMSGRVFIDWPPRELKRRAIYLSCGNSGSTALQDASVDLVITDPPFFDNVHYSELADFFFAWQQLGSTPFATIRTSTRHPDEVQDTSSEQFGAKLRSVFAECRRVLKDDGLLVFTYHQSRADGWLSLADAVVGAGFAIVNCHPVKAEMSVGTPKSQAKEPIQLDVILVCRKQMLDLRPKQVLPDAFRVATDGAIVKTRRLRDVGMDLSLNDKRVLLVGQFLAEACPGRSAAELSKALADCFADLDLMASRLPKSGREGVSYDGSDSPSAAQLVLLEKALKPFATNE